MAVRVAGVPLDDHKHVWIGLKSRILGVGRTTALKVCEATGVPLDKKVKELTDDEIKALSDEILGKYKVEGDLRREIGANIKRLRDIRCYRGDRHKRGLPVNGQRTKTNAKTRKGRKGSKKVA